MCSVVFCSFAIIAGSVEGFDMKHADLASVIYQCVFAVEKPQECEIDHFLDFDVANTFVAKVI